MGGESDGVVGHCDAVARQRDRRHGIRLASVNFPEPYFCSA